MTLLTARVFAAAAGCTAYLLSRRWSRSTHAYVVRRCFIAFLACSAIPFLSSKVLGPAATVSDRAILTMWWMVFGSLWHAQARQDFAEDFSRLNALLFTATDWIFIPAYCFALP